ncbi:MAG: nucleotidyltransferase domain-containing protein [Gallionella sp.]
MRLSDTQRSIIRSSVAQNFGADAVVWLFGSRVDDSQRGGDIDLYIESASDNAAQLIDAKLNLLVALQQQLGEQKIDVVIRRANSTADLPIYQIAKATGIKL